MTEFVCAACGDEIEEAEYDENEGLCDDCEETDYSV